VVQALVDIGWYAMVAWLVNRARLLFSRRGVRRHLEQASGVVLVGVGLRLAIEHR